MARHVPYTPSRRGSTNSRWRPVRSTYTPTGEHPVYTPQELASRRAQLLNIIDRAMTLLDALDDPFADLEPEPSEEGDADERSAQQLPPPLPVARHRRVRRAA